MTTWECEMVADRILMDLTRRSAGEAKAYLAEMVGAEEFETLYHGVRFRVMPNAAGITHVVIGSLAAGTYTLGCETLREAPGRSLHVHHVLRDLSSDELRSSFEQAATLLLPA